MYLTHAHYPFYSVRIEVNIIKHNQQGNDVASIKVGTCTHTEKDVKNQ